MTPDQLIRPEILALKAYHVADAEGMVALARTDRVSAAEQDSGRLPSQYVVMARSPDDLKDFQQGRWNRLPGRAGVTVWTDQRSDLLSLIRRK